MDDVNKDRIGEMVGCIGCGSAILAFIILILLIITTW